MYDHDDDFQMPPDATLIVGPAGGGKTEAAIQAILDTRQVSAFSTVWVLLATGQQIHAFQERLIARSPDAVQFGVEFFDFETLYMRLLDLLGSPQRQVEDTARFQILRHVTAGLRARGALELFGEIAHMPGFIGLLAGLIHELKQGLVQPDQFEQVAHHPGAKDRDLARIYAAYQDFLQDNHLVDRHGAGWLAVDHLERGGGLPVPVDLLVVDGFDQFNRVHIRLLTALARQVSRTLLTLTGTPGEPGRRFRRFEQTRTRVLQAAPDLWRTGILASVPADAARPPALDHLVSAVFLGELGQLPGGEAVHLIEAPDVGREVGAVLRRIKRLLLDGVSPESVAVIARDMHPYSTALRETAHAYGIPLVVREGVPLRENPAVALLLDLIDLSAVDFPRRDLLDTLHSPYLDPPGLTPDQMVWLDRISLAEQVVRGRAAWLDAAQAAGLDRRDEDGESIEGLDRADAALLRDGLTQFFDRITPPDSGTAYTLTRWLEDLIGPDPAAQALDAAEEIGPIEPDAGAADHLNVLGCVRATADAARAARDVSALQAFNRVLRGIRAAHDLLTRDGTLAVLSWSDFRAELGLAVECTTVIPPGGLSRSGRVLATNVLEARGLPHDHVFILGLSEGLFPAQEPEGALYQEGERLNLERQGIDMLTAVERSDDMSLFYQAIGLARRSLTLSRFTVDDKGAECHPSPYWQAVCAAVAIPADQKTRIRTGAAPSLDDAATLSEAAVAVAAVFSGETGENDINMAASMYNALLRHRAWGSRWRNVLRGRAIEARREDPASPFDRHSGLLTDPNLITIAARWLGPDHVWSASQFNDLGFCPFRFFARRLLNLEELEEPEEGLDPLQLGSINHAILERAYAQIAAEGLAIAPENLARALEILDAAAEAVFTRAPAAYGFRASPVWACERHEMRRRLRWLVEMDFGDKSPFRPVSSREGRPVARQVQDSVRQPYRLEAAFGPEGDLPALEIDGPAGSLRARGLIDRMDRAGNGVIVIDYKTGTTRHTVDDMAEGRDFQMMVYLLAARAILDRSDPGATVVGGLFWHIRNRQVSGEVRADDLALEAARAHLHAHVLSARAGRFFVRPGKMAGDRCSSFCEFRALCRLSRANLRKPTGNLTAEDAENAER
jgi:ATP-dependent helicase/DNAse subunit B